MNNLIFKIAAVSTGVVVGSLTAARAVAMPVQWSGNGNFYEAVLVGGDGITWNDALAAAEDAGGHLATITSAAENEFVSSLFAGNPDFWRNVGVDTRGPWIGGFQAPGSIEPDQGFMWVTDESFEYTNWALSADGSMQPNDGGGGAPEDSIHFLGAGNNNITADTWNDAPANAAISGGNPFGYIVEFEAESIPEPTSVLSLLGLGTLGIGSLLKRHQRSNSKSTNSIKD